MPGSRAYDLWIIVNDPLLTRMRLWHSTEAHIQRALGEHCRVRLCFSTAREVRKAKRTGDVRVVERLRSGITLFRAKRDAPGSRGGKGRGPWSTALLRFKQAEDAFRPASEQLRDAERAWFAERTIELSSDATVAVRDRRRLDRAIADEKRQGDRLHAATVALLHTPAPDLGAIVRKLELVRDVGDGDDPATVSILADIRWVAARLAQIGNLP